MMRWERHWWQAKTEPLPVLYSEPTVWVDPTLYEEAAQQPRIARGTIPPPNIVGAHCPLETKT